MRTEIEKARRQAIEVGVTAIIFMAAMAVILAWLVFGPAVMAPLPV